MPPRPPLLCLLLVATAATAAAAFVRPAPSAARGRRVQLSPRAHPRPPATIAFAADGDGDKEAPSDPYAYLKDLSPEELKAKVNAGFQDATNAPQDSDLNKGALPRDPKELMAVDAVIREKDSIIDEAAISRMVSWFFAELNLPNMTPTILYAPRHLALLRPLPHLSLPNQRRSPNRH